MSTTDTARQVRKLGRSAGQGPARARRRGAGSGRMWTRLCPRRDPCVQRAGVRRAGAKCIWGRPPAVGDACGAFGTRLSVSDHVIPPAEGSAITYSPTRSRSSPRGAGPRGELDAYVDRAERPGGRRRPSRTWRRRRRTNRRLLIGGPGGGRRAVPHPRRRRGPARRAALPAGGHVAVVLNRSRAIRTTRSQEATRMTEPNTAAAVTPLRPPPVRQATLIRSNRAHTFGTFRPDRRDAVAAEALFPPAATGSERWFRAAPRRTGLRDVGRRTVVAWDAPARFVLTWSPTPVPTEVGRTSTTNNSPRTARRPAGIAPAPTPPAGHGSWTA